MYLMIASIILFPMLGEASREIIGMAQSILTAVSASISDAVAEVVSTIVTVYEKRFHFHGKRVVIIVDEVVEGIDIDNVERYSKTLYNPINEIVDEFDTISAAARPSRARHWGVLCVAAQCL